MKEMVIVQLNYMAGGLLDFGYRLAGLLSSTICANSERGHVWRWGVFLFPFLVVLCLCVVQSMCVLCFNGGLYS